MGMVPSTSTPAAPRRVLGRNLLAALQGARTALFPANELCTPPSSCPHSPQLLLPKSLASGHLPAPLFHGDCPSGAQPKGQRQALRLPICSPSSNSFDFPKPYPGPWLPLVTGKTHFQQRSERTSRRLMLEAGVGRARHPFEIPPKAAHRALSRTAGLRKVCWSFRAHGVTEKQWQEEVPPGNPGNSVNVAWMVELRSWSWAGV